MGTSEEAKSSKSEKSSSPVLEQSNVHVYPDWAAMQAYYGHRVAVPPYFNSPVASGHPPHPYMWGPPQTMMPPYGTPYAAIYAHGGVYTHPGVPLGSHASGHGVVASAAGTEGMAAIPFNIDTPTKSSVNSDQGLVNKLKGFDGLAMTIGNGNTESAEGGTDNGISQSGETDGSSDDSNGTTSRMGQKSKKRSREGTPNAEERVSLTPRSPVTAGEVNGSSQKVLAVTLAAANATEKVMGPVLSPNMTTSLELRNNSGVNVKKSPANVPQSCPTLPNEAWLQNERELKRERRKQSNRESARRSRLRKQAETEELGKKVQSLTAENMTLRSEINKLVENSEQLRHENATLMDKLKSAQVSQVGDFNINKSDEMHVQPVGTADLLARVNNSSSADRSTEEGDVFENRNPGTKLHQLLDASPRTDAVAAG